MHRMFFSNIFEDAFLGYSFLDFSLHGTQREEMWFEITLTNQIKKISTLKRKEIVTYREFVAMAFLYHICIIVVSKLLKRQRWLEWELLNPVTMFSTSRVASHLATIVDNELRA